MGLSNVDTISAKMYYLLDKKEDIIVTGQQILDQVVNVKPIGDTIITIQTTAFYRFAKQDTVIWQGSEIAELMSQDQFYPIMGWGAFMFGLVIGWNLYFVNRYRKKDTIGFENITTIISALTGGVLITYFDNSTHLLGAYGAGIGVGFLLYFTLLLIFSCFSNDPLYKFPDFFLRVSSDQTPFIMRFRKKFQGGRMRDNKDLSGS